MKQYTLTPVPLEQLDGDSNLLQSGFWGSVKEESGQKPLSFIIGHDDESAPLLVLLRSFGAGMSLAYVPHGPQPPGSEKPETPPTEPPVFLQSVTDALRPWLPKNCVFLRYDLPWSMPDQFVAYQGLPQPFRKAAVDIQPPHTVVIDLTPDFDTMLARMKSKTRYNIRLARKKGVRIREGKREELSVWYDIYRETSERDKIAIHDQEYYTRPFAAAESYGGKSAELKLFFADIDDTTAAGIIVAAYGERCTYLYGASTGYKRNYMPTYLLQWHAMEWAKKQGCTSYDLFGIPPTDNPDHPMHGLYRFKTGFGGEIVSRFGCWDFPLKPLLYTISRSAENTRNWYYKKLKKR